jgi:hypothetical protein
VAFSVTAGDAEHVAAVGEPHADPDVRDRDYFLGGCERARSRVDVEDVDLGMFGVLVGKHIQGVLPGRTGLATGLNTARKLLSSGALPPIEPTEAGLFGDAAPVDGSIENW